MNNMLLFCESDVALRCPEVEMAQIFQGFFDLFSGAGSAPGYADSEWDDLVGGCFDRDSDASDPAALGRFQPNVGRTSEIGYIYILYIYNRFVLSEQADEVS
jgi:hypothetical protein